MNILSQLGTRIMFFDGGCGTILQSKGLKAGVLPETWNITHADIITDMHKDYINAGCDILKTNTFGANGFKFNDSSEYSLHEIVNAAVNNARKAVEDTEHDRHIYIALDIGPSGKLLKPIGTVTFDEMYEIFAQVVREGVKAGAELVLIETMSDSYEMKAAVLAAKENSDLPVFATAAFDEKKKLLTGGSPLSVVSMLEGLGVDALGINCGLGPDKMKPIFEEIVQYASVPVIVNPNAGLPREENGRTVFDIGPEQFTDTMEQIVRDGALVVGGCCGTTPDHIRELVKRCSNITPVPVTEKDYTVVTSYSQAVVIGEKPVIIGERINPTGKSKFKQALRDNNIEYIVNEGIKQQDNGANILDVNVGLPEINETEMMERVVYELQSIMDLPLQIDTTSREAMERAMRIYNGKPMVNSVNGKKENMEMIFPLVKKYGGVVVGLTLDEDGIPSTIEGRLAIADKIYRTAAEYGIKKKDIVIDALTMTMSTDSQSAKITLGTVKKITEMGGRTVLGVSNISFGLPNREIINSYFFANALAAGLSAGIINPGSAMMMQAYDTNAVLAGFDANCASYISKYSNVQITQTQAGSAAATATTQAVRSLKECIVKGLKDEAFRITVDMLKDKKPLDIINEELVPALDEVGKGFEKGTLYLPQLLMSAEAAKSGFEAIKDHLTKTGTEQEKKATIVIATVKGDIHDIGKNIVKVLLENYSYDVIDLGKDVAPETIVETVVKTKAPLVGLSALMTTTVVNMEETIKQLRKSAPWAKIMVGGAVLTQEYADSIGADFYGKDAMASVYYTESLKLWEK